MADSCCHVCKQSSAEASLKRCSKCSTTLYCSRDCQRADWKTHRKTCARQPSSPDDAAASGARLSPPKGLDQPIERPFTRLDNNTWLHDRPEIDVYRLLIDAYRLRVEDDYKLSGELQPHSIYDGARNGLRGFTRFLRLVASRGRLLPPWWTPEKERACKRLGMDSSQWHDLRCAVEKSDIIEHYGHPQFPIQLRMFAEAAIGRGPGGSDGTQLRQAMMSVEQGSGTHVLTIDNTTGRIS
ncbi:putative MYND domain protein [Xylaria intraflava]|nr:putative MYND domain protein [Xylaria intraflava]